MYQKKSKWLVCIIIISLVTAMLSMGVPAFAEDEGSIDVETAVEYDDDNQPYLPGQLIIGYARNTTAESKRSIRAQMQLELKTPLPFVDAELVKVDKQKTKEMHGQLSRNPNIAYVEYDYLMTVDHTPNDPSYVSQIYLPYMNTPKAWDITKGSPDVTVAVLDTGLKTINTDLKGMSVSGYNVLTSTTDYTDDHSHGTYVTSVIAAEMDNAFGFAGIAPGVRFLAVKVMTSSGTGTYSDMIKGIAYAVENGADVINMSIGGRVDSTALKLAVDNAVGSGVTIVAAAGNEGLTTLSFPAAYNNVVGVGAVSTTDTKMSYSNTGDGLTVMAGGTAKVATFTDYISSAAGTSFASPYVTGLVALMYSVNADMNPDRVFDILSQTSRDIGASGYDTTFGYGVVNMGEAVRIAAEGSVVPVPLPDTTPPTLTLNGSDSLSLDQGVPYVESGATAIDDVDGDISNRVVITGQVDTAVIGQYSLSYSVKDNAGNASVILKRVIDVKAPSPVIDTTPPILTLNGSSSMTLELGTTYVEPGVQASDDVDGDISSWVVVNGTVDQSIVGVYELIYTVTDSAGNVAQPLKRTVEITEPVPETIDLPPETVFIRDVELIEGSLSKRTPLLSHTITIANSGKLDIELTYIGKVPPELTITNLDFSGNYGSFDVEPGNYVMTLKSTANVRYSVRLTYPEREVPVGTPQGEPEVIIYEVSYDYIWYSYLAVSLTLFFILAFMFATGRIKFIKHSTP